VIYIGLGIISARHTQAPFKWPFSSFLIYLLPDSFRKYPRPDLEANAYTAALPSKSTGSTAFPSIDKHSLRLIDEVDLDIFYRVLGDAVNKDEMVTVLNHLYQPPLLGTCKYAF